MLIYNKTEVDWQINTNTTMSELLRRSGEWIKKAISEKNKLSAQKHGQKKEKEKHR